MNNVVYQLCYQCLHVNLTCSSLEQKKKTEFNTHESPSVHLPDLERIF